MKSEARYAHTIYRESVFDWSRGDKNLEDRVQSKKMYNTFRIKIWLLATDCNLPWAKNVMCVYDLNHLWILNIVRTRLKY